MRTAAAGSETQTQTERQKVITYDADLHAANIAALNAKHDAADAAMKNETGHSAQQSWADYVKGKVKATAAASGYKPPFAVVMEGTAAA
jgi:hypothetical protein